MTYIARVSLKPKGPPLFPPGRLVATPGAIELMSITETSPLVLIARHVAGDWGDCHPDDVQVNNDAVRDGYRVMSVYRLPLLEKNAQEHVGPRMLDTEDDRVWVITEETALQIVTPPLANTARYDGLRGQEVDHA